jgi:cbb3-type cytochrome c oxidase subunit III
MEKTLRKVTFASLALLVCLGSLYTDNRARAKEKLALETDRDPGVLFDKNCATCHGKDGQAKTFKAKFNHARNLTDAKWQAEASDERLFNSISNGKGKMPAWGKKFSEAEINALVAYVRKLKQ